MPCHAARAAQAEIDQITDAMAASPMAQSGGGAFGGSLVSACMKLFDMCKRYAMCELWQCHVSLPNELTVLPLPLYGAIKVLLSHAIALQISRSCCGRGTAAP